jgi:putative MFS transporter
MDALFSRMHLNTLVQSPGCYSAALLLDRVGRKPILALYLAVAGIASLLLSTTCDIDMIPSIAT